MSRLDAERKTLEVLAEEFVARYRRGERPALAEYMDAHPELAHEIRELFPTLVMMEELAPGDSTPEHAYEETYRLRTLKAMARKAESLGYKLVPATE
jgi:hypothetical protein